MLYRYALVAAMTLAFAESSAQSGWFWSNPYPQGNWLFGVSFVDANTGTAVGGLGTILHTTDGGSSWTSQASGTGSSLHGVCFTDVNTGTAVGYDGLILRTTNGGMSWMRQSSGTTIELYAAAWPVSAPSP